jgi:hypothetical protein
MPLEDRSSPYRSRGRWTWDCLAGVACGKIANVACGKIAKEESAPCSQGSSSYRSLDSLWLPAHSLKPLKPLSPRPLQPPPRRVARSRVLRKSIQTGSQVTSPTSHVRRVLHSTGGVLALAALFVVRGIFEALASRSKSDKLLSQLTPRGA